MKTQIFNDKSPKRVIELIDKWLYANLGMAIVSIVIAEGQIGVWSGTITYRH